MESLKDKVVLVVGGATGIGLGIGTAFAREGCKVALAGRTEATLAAARKTPNTAFLTRTADATDRGQIASLMAWVLETAGPIDILVYSAGINIPKRSFTEIDPDEFDQVMKVNATGAFNCIHAVLPSMRERRLGLIINVVSVAGLRNMKLAGLPYCASKFAQASIGTYANLETLPEGVAITNLYPGETNTPILDKRPEPPPAEKRAQMIQPEDVGELAVAVARLPARATVPEIVITPRHMPLT